jgi:hypothetical protein
MIILRKPLSGINRPSSTHTLIESPRTWASPKNIARLAVLIAGVGVILCIPLAPNVLAKTGHPPAAQANSDIEPDAMAALNKMGSYLRTLKAFQVDSEITHDEVLDDGQIITDTRKDTLLAVAPRYMRVEIKGDDRNVFLFFDGKNFTVYGKLDNFYATVPAPPTIKELIEKVDSQYGIEIPLIDLFKWGTDQSDVKKITSAIDVGPSTIEGVTCEHYAFRQEGVDWQVWIQLGDYPLPRKLVIRTLTDDARPEHTSTLSWNLAPSYNEAAFTFEPPPGAQRIVLKDLNSDGTKK